MVASVFVGCGRWCVRRARHGLTGDASDAPTCLPAGSRVTRRSSGRSRRSSSSSRSSDKRRRSCSRARLGQHRCQRRGRSSSDDGRRPAAAATSSCRQGWGLGWGLPSAAFCRGCRACWRRCWGWGSRWRQQHQAAAERKPSEAARLNVPALASARKLVQAGHGRATFPVFAIFAVLASERPIHPAICRHVAEHHCAVPPRHASCLAGGRGTPNGIAEACRVAGCAGSAPGGARQLAAAQPVTAGLRRLCDTAWCGHKCVCADAGSP